MRKQSSDKSLHWMHESRWVARTLSILLLAVVGVLDYATGREISFTLFYLLPIATAVWFLERRIGIAMCLAATAIGIAVQLFDQMPLAGTLWNSSIALGVYLIICILLAYVKTHNIKSPLFMGINRIVAVAIGLGCILAVAGGLVQHQFPERTGINRAANPPVVVTKSAVRLLASAADECMKSSRPLLLGSRDPNGPSCVDVVRTGDIKQSVPNNHGDLNGGPGTTVATIYFFDRQEFKTAMQDFTWHQGRFKTYLENTQVVNDLAAQRADQLAAKTKEFAEMTNGWTRVPTELTSIGYTNRDDWPSYCVAELDQAVANKDLTGLKRWAGELAAATFALSDLHRWLGFLVKNHLTALAFQRDSEAIFAEADASGAPYDPRSTISWFPAGVLSLNGVGNYLEVERQAERLFSMPVDRTIALASDKKPAANALYISPALRDIYLNLESPLSSENQKTWEQSAQTPYEHSYLENMLYRAKHADTADYLCTVLKKFDQVNPHATVGELMSVIMYRGHSFAGLEWADRFQPELLHASEQIPTNESDLDALLGACKWTNSFYDPTNYGVTFTLRDALEQKRLDCVRATDMIGAIFRNAGRTRFGNVRWCASTGGHSVAAYFEAAGNEIKPKIVDGLMPPSAPESWPECYFHGHQWPPGLQNNAPPYAVEMYARGIDSYIWMEGYQVRGPKAGWLTSAAIPYSTSRREFHSKRVFDGPYPR